MLFRSLGGVYSYLSGLCENRYESSCKKLLAECISAVLAGFIGMYLAVMFMNVSSSGKINP